MESGEYGRLISVTAHRLGSYLRAGAADHKEHYSDPTTELMTFDVDFIDWVMGPPARVSASAVAWQGAMGEANALLGYDDGRAATVLASGSMPASFPFTTGFVALFEHTAFETEAVFADGAIKVSHQLFLGSGHAQPVLPDANPYQRELEHFVDCIRGKADAALLDADRAIEALALSLAVQTSLHEHRTVAFGVQPS